MKCNHTPLITVVILTYNNFNGLFNTINSILNQTYKNYELLISDDFSDTFPLEQLESWSKANPEVKIEIRRNSSNLGITAHANIAARASCGEYIKFLPPGDGFYTEYALERLVTRAVETEAEVLTSPCLVYKSNYENVRYMYPPRHKLRMLVNQDSRKLFSKMAMGNFISAVGTIFHRRFFDRGGFNEGYRYLDDWPVWLSRYRKKLKIDVLEIPTVYYGLNGVSNNGGNAYESKLLRDDMILCYEEEIIPYKELLSPFERWFVNYRYGKLVGDQSIRFRFTYLPAELYCRTKKVAKHIVMSGSARQR